MEKSLKKIKVGVIGLGFGRQIHIPAFNSHPNCEVTAVCSAELQDTSDVAAQLGIPKVFKDWNEMLDDPDIDAISIATPPGVQTDIAISALSKGKAVFAEKPLALNNIEANRMVQAAEQANVANMIDFEFPEIEEWQNARSILDRGDIGKLRHIAVSWNVETYANKMRLNSWKTRLEDGGGALNSFASHVFYYLEWFAGPIKGISSRMYKFPGDNRTGDTLDILCIELESGVPASLSISNHAFLGNGHRLEFYGDQGTLVLDNPSSDYVSGFRLLLGTRKTNKLEVVNSNEHLRKDVKDARVIPVSRMVERFVRWMETGLPEQPSFKSGSRVQDLLEAARRSSESGCWVERPFRTPKTRICS